MRVSQVAFDRFVVELPSPEPGYLPLADREEVEHLVRFLWDFGTHPVLALVAADDVSWCQPWLTRRVSWVPADADDGALEIAWRPDRASYAVVLRSEDDLRRFLVQCPAISKAAVLWPRVEGDMAKCFRRLAENGDWRPAAEACAFFARAGSQITVQQLAEPAPR